MKYFLDTEFLEGPQKEKFPISLFRKQTPNTIDLISIGIVAEDGREYYAVSKDFNLEEAWNRFQREEQTSFEKQNGFDGKKIYWLRDNVLKPIWRELIKTYELTNDIYSNSQADLFNKGVDAGYFDKRFSYKSLKSLLKLYGKTNKEISEKVISFTTNAKFEENEKGKFKIGSDLSDKITKGDIVWDKPEFYAYYADYDWVVFCWLFGKMIDLPDGFPTYCKDLKQMLDDKVNFYMPLPMKFFGRKPTSFNDALKRFKNHPDYPKQDPSKSHNAIEDARWNKQLYEFLTKL